MQHIVVFPRVRVAPKAVWWCSALTAHYALCSPCHVSVTDAVIKDAICGQWFRTGEAPAQPKKKKKEGVGSAINWVDTLLPGSLPTNKQIWKMRGKLSRLQMFFTFFSPRFLWPWLWHLQCPPSPLSTKFSIYWIILLHYEAICTVNFYHQKQKALRFY